jgi:hypothetical protein
VLDDGSGELGHLLASGRREGRILEGEAVEKRVDERMGVRGVLERESRSP